jgi:hypothetical protein
LSELELDDVLGGLLKGVLGAFDCPLGLQVVAPWLELART